MSELMSVAKRKGKPLLSGFFAKSSSAVLGIDISSTSIKVVELGKGRSGPTLQQYVIEPLSPGVVVDRNIADVEAVGKAVAAAVKRAKIQTRQVAVAVAGSAVITKVIAMPADLSESEMENQVSLEAGQYIPFPLEEVNYDFQVLGPVANNPNQVNVLLAASRSENVEARVSALEVAGLTAKVVDVEAYAIENAFRLLALPTGKGGGDRVAGLIDLGANNTILHVFQGGQSIYTREQVFGCAQISDEIMREYGVGKEEADAIRNQRQPAPEGYDERILQPFRDNVVRQIGRALQFFFSSSHLDGVDYLVIAGGGGAIPGIEQAISDGMGTPAIIANPFASMAVASRINAAQLRQDAPALMIACGLAMRSID